MRSIIYAGLLYDYGEPQNGNSFEYYNLEAGIRDCQSRGIFGEVEYFHPDKILLEEGQKGLADRLLSLVQSGRFEEF